MARRRKGRNISGWLIVDKPAGITSTAVVNKVRWAFDAQKAGHAGTLDPDATGVLAVALGEATKTVPYVSECLKAYEFTVRFGQSTNTDDAEGEVIGESALRPSDDAIKSALGSFVGEIMQVPPIFSAVKVDGQRAYKMARDGHDLQLAARPLWVESLVLIDRPDEDHARFELVCGKGGYVRSIARDLGGSLGCLGHVRELRRIWSGSFRADEAVDMETVDRLAKTSEIDSYLRPIQEGLQGLPEVIVAADNVQKLRNGNPARVIASSVGYGDECWVSHQGEPVAVGIYRSGEIHPNRVFVKADE
ncbi:tRNA pseudouridine(55) synthase TruB [Pelagovum sp. HNIBRBA483]|uniref:tRNA pseudouridine(55) synthase TruB n=1 Tax=Pelagovum sp. HNIBRBA483 TaxID=3233341 RepID=UPI0034A3E84E